jgi:transposase
VLTAEEIFTKALYLVAPWIPVDLKFSQSEKLLEIWISYRQNSKFPCPKCNCLDCSIHDRQTRTWRHLNFFDHTAIIHGTVPRIRCPNCGVHQVIVPWARSDCGFTLLMEADIISLAHSMQISQIAKNLAITDKRIWRVIEYQVNEALKNNVYSTITCFGVDETSRKKGHEYITVFADLLTGKVLFVCKGKDAETLKLFSDHLTQNNGKVDNIAFVCCDMSPAFIKGIHDEFPSASIVFDKFHVMKMMNEAVDETRREEQKLNRILLKSRYLWLSNPNNLKKEQLDRLIKLKLMNLKTVRAYDLKISLQNFWTSGDADIARAYFKKWYFRATHSHLPAIIKVAKSLKNHYDGIISYFTYQQTNGLLEGLNSTIQSLKTNAKGYRNDDNFITMIYLRCGQLKFNLPNLGNTN